MVEDTRYPVDFHGVGASVVNALSNWLEVEIYHEGKVYQQRYERGKVMEKLTVIGDCEEEKTGTKVTFLPDDTIFETTIFDFNVPETEIPRDGIPDKRAENRIEGRP